MKAPIHNTQGKSVSRDIELSDEVFGIEPNEHCIYLAVKQYLAAQRQGTHSAREKSQLSGSTRKLKKQKGTGTARAGSIKNPLFRGGARVFGPRPRTYEIRLNKKVKALARKSVLSAKAASGELRVVEDFNFDNPRTKDARALVDSFSDKGNVLIVIGERNDNIRRSFANLPNAKLVTAESLNVYDVVHATTLLMTESGVQSVQNTFGITANA